MSTTTPLDHYPPTPSFRLEPVLAHTFDDQPPWKAGIIAQDAGTGGSKQYLAVRDIPAWLATLEETEHDTHAYEILPEGRPVYPYLDVEYDAAQLTDEEVLETLFYAMAACLQRIGGTHIHGVSVYTASGPCSTDRIASGQKASFHMVFESREVFRSTVEQRIFIHQVLLPHLKETDAEQTLTWTTAKGQHLLATDPIPYMRNQAFRLPFQSKWGSSRTLRRYDLTRIGIHVPQTQHIAVGVYTDPSTHTYLDLGPLRTAPTTTLTPRPHGGMEGRLSPEFERAIALAEELTTEWMTGYEEARNAVWCLWAVEQTPRMRDVIHRICQRGRNYEAKWVEGLLRGWRAARLSLGSLVYWVRHLKGPTVVRRILKANPIEYHKELFQVTMIPAEHTVVKVRYLSTVREAGFRHKDTADTLLLRSHLGTGKTVAITNLIRMGTYQRILILSPRRSYTHSLMGTLREDGTLPSFVSYMEQTGGLSDVPYLVVQVESVHRIFRHFVPYDLVILDEVESILNQLHSVTTNGIHLINNHDVLAMAVQTARRVVMADAFLSDRTMYFAKELRCPARTRYVENQFQPYDRQAIYLRPLPPPPLIEPDPKKKAGGRKKKTEETKDPEEQKQEAKEQKEEAEEATHILPANLYGLCHRMMEALHAGRRIVVLWTSKRRGEWFARSFLEKEGISHLYYHSDTTKEDQLGLQDVHATWAGVQCLMMTTSITVGISYDPDEEAVKFDEAFLYGSNATAMPRDIAQALLRVRALKADRLTYVIDVRPTSVDYDTTRGFQNVWATMQAKEAACLRDHPLTNWYMCPDWAKWNHVYNENEERCSRMEYQAVLEKYLALCGYQKVEEDEIPTEAFQAAHPGAGAGGGTALAWDAIPFLSDTAAEALRDTLRRGDGLEVEDRLALKKWVFQSVLERAAPMAAQEALWREYIESGRDALFWNARSERWWSLEAYADQEARRRYAMMSTSTLRLRTALQKFLDATGMTHSLEERVFEHEELVAMGPAVEAVQKAVREGMGLRATRRKEGAWTVSHTVDLIQEVISKWSGGYVEVTTKKKREKTKFIYQFRIELNTGHPLWNMFRRNAEEVDECLISL